MPFLGLLFILTSSESTIAINEGISTQQDSSYIVKADKLPAPSPSPLVAPPRASSNDINKLIGDVVIKYGLNYAEYYGTLKDESALIPTNIGPGGLSVGIAMFRLDTWLENCSIKDDRTNVPKALDCMGKMFARGEQGRWDVWCKKYQPLEGNWRCRVRGL